MAVQTTPYIGKPGMQCTPGRVCGPGGSPVAVPRNGRGGAGGAGGGGGGSQWPHRKTARGDLHPAVLPPRPHVLVGCKPRPRCGVVPRAGVLVLRGQRRRPCAGKTAYHVAYTLGIEASTARAAAYRSRGVARGLSPRERHQTVPSWVTPWPRDSYSSPSQPSIRAPSARGALLQACGVAAPPRGSGRRLKIQRGASRGAT